MYDERRFGMRISGVELESWTYYSIKVGYKSLSAFVRDSINGLIRAKQKPSKIIIIENKEVSDVVCPTD